MGSITIRSLAIIVAAVLAAPTPAQGQSSSRDKLPDLSGTWQVETPEGPQEVVIRPDSSASFGDETVRWRLVPDTIYLVLGGEWMGYNFARKGRVLTLWGGDLEEPVELKRIGPPTPRPEGVPVPPIPSASAPGG
ncbi:MAG: hypothetical protein GTN62_08665 [Gemmatimonadales bacterium]|nr:hypothetical protein [Gemmatimonadales bacterium]NIN50169.1 hypothetical protein [Gemmatimonadales bacterium]NIP07633.1 hypothetical protein [Gemmatimonadales bacterium]NIR01785.1 hypothetical protein [Gemmatimonadales bacterium]NIS65688.1 hypothetical protein [Gemmatimonadales bacterium]